MTTVSHRSLRRERLRALSGHSIPFRSSSGILVAFVKLTPAAASADENSTSIIEIDEVEAREHGETAIQLRESDRYEYEVFSENGDDLRLRCSLSSRRRSLVDASVRDAGLIETRAFCGTLLLELVEGRVDNLKSSVASALIDVRSLKLNYRTEYRGMLRSLADEMAGLVADARSSAKVSFKSSLEERSDEGWLQIQLELLRETLDSSDFAAAVQRIISYPHERLTNVMDRVSTDRPIQWTAVAISQLVRNNPRRAVPAGHPLRSSTGLETVGQDVYIPRRSRDLDTAENRFIKFALIEFRAFLTHAQLIFESCRGWDASASLAKRLTGTIDDWLGRSLFREIGPMVLAPLGSPVLQRKSGYREVFRWWLRFKTAAELSWTAGEDLFRAGQRDVASLYEYWVFFQLLDWFYRICHDGDRPAIEELVDGLDAGSPNLRLQKRMELGPFVGTVAGSSRKLNARFSYNKRFGTTKERFRGGSWTRALHPDYTFTFWPDGVDEENAERDELLVHVHFDAKYRVENIEELFGVEDSEDADDETAGKYKRQDLLKMHAYRDAIKRSQGAYVLYPGQFSTNVRFQGFHEILPGLGAFSLAPDELGNAQGMDRLSKFLDETLSHLCNRATSQERVGFHLMESYQLKMESMQFRMPLSEFDSFRSKYRALPPAEHMVAVAWGYSYLQFQWMRAKKLAVVRLGSSVGLHRVQATMAGVRHLLLLGDVFGVSPGLWPLTWPGFRLMTDKDLAALGYPSPILGEMHAVFDVAKEPDWSALVWSPKAVLKAIYRFEDLESPRSDMTSEAKSRLVRIVSLACLFDGLGKK